MRNRHALLYTFGVGKLLFQAEACGTRNDKIIISMQFLHSSLRIVHDSYVRSICMVAHNMRGVVWEGPCTDHSYVAPHKHSGANPFSLSLSPSLSLSLEKNLLVLQFGEVGNK